MEKLRTVETTVQQSRAVTKRESEKLKFLDIHFSKKEKKYRED